MRVAVPFTPDRLRGETIQATLAAAKLAAASVTFWDVSGSDTAYAHALACAWDEAREAREDLVVIEHDIVVHATALAEFDACVHPHAYCCFPYAWTTCVGPALGCTRFRRELLESVPDAVERAAAIPSAWGQPGHWRQLDVHLMRQVLRDEEWLQPHVHETVVRHLNPERQLEPGASAEPVLEVRGL